jgi:hypothetical protein
VLAAVVLLAARGSRRAQLVWVGMLGYVVHAYAYYIFVPTHGDGFLDLLSVARPILFSGHVVIGDDKEITVAGQTINEAFVVLRGER